MLCPVVRLKPHFSCVPTTCRFSSISSSEWMNDAMVMLRPRTDASKLLRRVLQGMNGWVRRSSLAAGLAIGIVGDAGVRPAFFLELNGGFEPPSRFSTTEEVSLEDYAESCMTPRDLLWCLTLMTEIRFLFGLEQTRNQIAAIGHVRLSRQLLVFLIHQYEHLEKLSIHFYYDVFFFFLSLI